MFFHKKRVQKHSCRREQVRDQLPEADSLVVEVDTPSGHSFPAELYDLTIDGSGILVPEDLVGPLAEDEIVEFTLAHPMHGWFVRTPARVVRVLPQSPGTALIGVQFINTGNLYAQLDDAMGRYFNRRKQTRVHPDEDQTIDVHVSAGSTQILGRIYDISETGLGVAMPYIHGMEVHPDMELQLKFRLPTSKKTIRGNIKVCQRRMMGEYAFVGMTLGSDFEPYRKVIMDFIEERQQAAEQFESCFQDLDADDGPLPEVDAA